MTGLGVAAPQHPSTLTGGYGPNAPKFTTSSPGLSIACNVVFRFGASLKEEWRRKFRVGLCIRHADETAPVREFADERHIISLSA